MSPEEAIHKRGGARFRPIMMTTLAALMGTVPIALGTGASAELRQPLGIAVVGGLLASQAADAVHHAGDLCRDGALEPLPESPLAWRSGGAGDCVLRAGRVGVAATSRRIGGAKEIARPCRNASGLFVLLS
jgi:hypothetical protein